MSTVRPIWTLVLVPLTAIAVFAAYRALTQDFAERSAGATHERSATISIESAATRATSPTAAAEESRGATDASMPSALLSPAQQEVAAMSETFRNTTLLIAIRQAGFVCEHMLGAERGAEDVAAWRVRCSDAVAYLVGVDAAGNLNVGPMTYGDGLRTSPSAFPPQSDQLPGPDSTRLDQLRQ